MNLKRSNRTLLFMLLCMAIIGFCVIFNVLYIMITQKHLLSGVNIKEFKDADVTNNHVIKAERGTIYDRNHEVIAQDEDIYTLIAYLDESRKGINESIAYVDDIRKTAHLLASPLKSDEETIYNILKNAKDSNKYQTELGYIGKNITASCKKEIDSLNLPGIEFSKGVRRHYPNGVFASHLIGYAQYNEEKKNLVGMMGIESTLNDYLTGHDGEEVYQKDINGIILPGTNYVKSFAKDGADVYLTLDQNVQLTLQSALEKTITDEKGKVGWGIVMEVETGRILGYASYPSFDMNNRNNLNDYTDVPSSYLYEPGSVMKGITYAAAIDSGVYPYDQKYKCKVFYYGVDERGKIYRSETPVAGLAPIRDALGKDYGVLTFDEGFMHSSNIAICELLTNYLNPEAYKDYIRKFGFLQKVDIPFVRNSAGSMSWKYASDKLSVGFGQGINITALQMVQAYSAILNDGKMVRPYVVEKIMDPNSKKVVKQYGTQIMGTPIKKETSDYMRKLMKMVISEEGTGYLYHLDDVEVIGKTGTGEIAGKNGYDGSLYTNSTMLAAPYDDPKVMVYYCFQSKDILGYSREPMREVMRAALVASNISANQIQPDEKEYVDWEIYTMPSLTNHSIDFATKKLEKLAVQTIKIGNGTQIVQQYPQEGDTIVSNQNIFLLTDDQSYTMPNMIGWTKKDLTTFWELSGISIQMEGSGHVVSQNIKEGSPINKDLKIVVTMK